MTLDQYEVHTTSNYAIFKFRQPIDTVSVPEYMQEDACKGKIVHPIVVSRDMNIVDGQRRFVALKNQGLPVQYVVFPESVLDDPEVKDILVHSIGINSKYCK